MAYTLCSSGAAKLKSGLSDSTVEATLTTSQLDDLSDESESIIASIARKDVVTNFGSLTANGKQLLANLSSNMIGQKIAMRLRSEYSSQREFETILDIIENDVRRDLSIIKEDKNKTYLGVT